MSLKLPLASVLQHLKGISEYGNPIASCAGCPQKCFSTRIVGSAWEAVSAGLPRTIFNPFFATPTSLSHLSTHHDSIGTDIHQELLVGFTTLHPPLLHPSKALRRHHCKCGYVRRFLDDMSTGPILLCSLLPLCSIALLCVLALHIL